MCWHDMNLRWGERELNMISWSVMWCVLFCKGRVNDCSDDSRSDRSKNFWEGILVPKRSEPWRLMYHSAMLHRSHVFPGCRFFPFSSKWLLGFHEPFFRDALNEYLLYSLRLLAFKWYTRSVQFHPCEWLPCSQSVAWWLMGVGKLRHMALTIAASCASSNSGPRIRRACWAKSCLFFLLGVGPLPAFLIPPFLANLNFIFASSCALSAITNADSRVLWVQRSP